MRLINVLEDMDADPVYSPQDGEDAQRLEFLEERVGELMILMSRSLSYLFPKVTDGFAISRVWHILLLPADDIYTDNVVSIDTARK
jgi:hypothetical protein